MSEPNAASSFLDRIEIVTATGRYRLGGPPVAPAGTDPGPARARTLAAEAMRWSYLLRSRERWRDSADVLARHERDAGDTLHAFGLDDKALREIAVAGRVVVTMPYASEREGWDARIFPWEYVLSRATARHRSSAPALVVMRQLLVAELLQRWPAELQSGWYRGRSLAPRVLLVQSFPGALTHAYDAQEEATRVRLALGLAGDDDARWRALDTPTLDELRALCAAFKPQIVHVTGCDNHQGLALLREYAGDDAMVRRGERLRPVGEWLHDDDGVIDGYLMRGSDGLPGMVAPQQLGRALTAGNTHAPFFVGLNLWNSAARIAPLLLAEGVVASMGFQDAFDDSLAEYFFETLYAALPRLAWCLPDAFEGAWAATRRQVDLVPGTGVALWAREALVEQAAAAKATPRAPRAGAAAAAAVSAAGLPRPARGRPAGPPKLHPLVEPKSEINYAELHNRGALFKRLELRGPVTDPPTRVHVLVELHCGPERARYEAEIELGDERLNLNERVRVPLTAMLMRSVSEAVTSTLFVQLQCDGSVIHKDTYTLRLLPVDQWLDNAKSGHWLPSFVLPRDPAVERAISAAQRYVRVIRDDPNAGFEGYQSATADDPESLDNVDLQVEAIWSALLHEWQLGYINPPPTYNQALDSQRLRTPSAIQHHRMGTCIDLALLFAACLELVDIHPVVFLLDGHALPGYWRHRDFQVAYREMDYFSQVVAPSDERRDAAPGTQSQPWRVGKAGYREVWRFIREGRLAPLETVRLTEHCSFREARAAGVEALKSARDFDSILDIATAREHLVTPLPIVGGERS